MNNPDRDASPSDLPWTGLNGTDLMSKAIDTQCKRPGVKYRCQDLTMRYYQAADQIFEYRYSRALDLAILAWSTSAVMDQDRGAHAKNWLSNTLGEDVGDAELSGLIDDCAQINLSGDARLLLISLSDLIDFDRSIANVDLIRSDAKFQFRMDDATFYLSFNDYLSRLKGKLQTSGLIGLSAREETALDAIKFGLGRLQCHISGLQKNDGDE